MKSKTGNMIKIELDWLSFAWRALATTSSNIFTQIDCIEGMLVSVLDFLRMHVLDYSAARYGRWQKW
jgi:hypothetical protein